MKRYMKEICGDLIKEITDINFGKLELEGFSHEECEEILKFACVS